MSATVRSETLPVSFTQGELAGLNHRFDAGDPSEILDWVSATFSGERVALSTTFGVGGMVLIHMLAERGIRLPVVFIDTLYHFPETLEHAERVRRRYDLDLQIHRPAESREAFESVHGERLWERDEDLFHTLTKVEPMKTALDHVDVWVTGRRRDQSPTRAALRVLEATAWLKVNPLATWDRERIWTYILTHDVPYHPLHDQGYASIGDAPLTTPIEPGEHERAGRWRGSIRLECGLHGI